MITDIANPVDDADMIVTTSRNKSIPIETMTDLPVNLVEEILSRVPLKSMRAVRLTCKEWDALSKSPSFSEMHIGKLSAGESMMVAWIDYNLYLMRVSLVDNEDPSIEWKGKLTCSDKQNKISKVIHCDGLLLCLLKEDDTKVIVWNPYWGQTRSIECRYSHRPEGGVKFSYAIGYEDKGSCIRSYKFLRFIGQYYRTSRNQFLCYEIYDLDSSSWKTIDVTPHWRILFDQLGAVSLKGNTYWPALQRNTNYGIDHIICFDFTSESFGPLLRLPFDAGVFDYVRLSCVREEKLAVLRSHEEEAFLVEIWISTKIEAEKVSWSKFLRVEMETGFYGLITSKTFFIDEEKKVVMGFEDCYSKTFNIIGEDGYLKKLELVERTGSDGNCKANACSYVPGLVQIKQPA